MRYNLIKANRVISHFDYQDISTKQLIQLHRLGYTFGISDKQDNSLLANQAGLAGTSHEVAAQQ